MARSLLYLLPCLAALGSFPAHAEEDRLSGWTLKEIARIPWGEGSRQLGRSLPSEGNPECPSSLDVDAQGRVFVLDQLNSRVQVIEKGAAVRAIPAPPASQDLALLPKDRLALLDRLVGREVLIVDGSGNRLGNLRLAGKGVADPAGVTALFARGDGLWVEYDNARLTRLAGLDLVAKEAREARSGRLAQAGGPAFSASRASRREVSLRREAVGGKGGWSRKISFSHDVLRILALEIDSEGRSFLAVDLVESTADGSLRSLSSEIVALDREGRELRRFRLPPFNGPEEQLRPIRIGADGAIYQLRCEPDAAVIRRLGP